jgi:hypothetical protein
LAEDQEVDSLAFIRQRRNLILASLVLTFAQGTHLTVHKLSFFGAEGAIEGPVSTVPYLWILWAYFLWRYWQSFCAAKKKPTKERYREIEKQAVESTAVQRGLKPYRGTQTQLLPGAQEPVNAWMPQDEQTTAKGAKAVLLTNMTDQSGRQKNIEVEISHLVVRWIKVKALVAFYSHQTSLASTTCHS